VLGGRLELVAMGRLGQRLLIVYFLVLDSDFELGPILVIFLVPSITWLRVLALDDCFIVEDERGALLLDGGALLGGAELERVAGFLLPIKTG